MQFFSTRTLSTFIAWGGLVLSLTATATGAEEVAVGQSPFFVERIEVTPGGKLLLRPRLPYVEELADGDYTLKLDLPAHIAPSPMLVAIRSQNRLGPIKETVANTTRGVESRTTLSYTPDPEDIWSDGMELRLCYISKSGVVACHRLMKFAGSFDWKVREKLTHVPDDVAQIKPILMLKPGGTSVRSGTLWVRSLDIQEVDTRKSVCKIAIQKPVSLTSGQSTPVPLLPQPLSGGDIAGLTPGKDYVVVCEVKADNITGSFAAIRDTWRKNPFYSRMLVFDVSPNVSLPCRLFWSIEDSKGRVFREGRVVLVQAGKTVKPKTLETSVWTCETGFDYESLPVQKLIIQKFDAWGLNTIEPGVRDPIYGTPLNRETLLSSQAQEAKRLGMRVRSYLHFIYSTKYSSPYLAAHPDCATVNAKGDKVSLGLPVCITHCLEGGAFDDSPTDVPGGKENPWIAYYYQAVKTLVAVNSLDGVFFDFEINAAPHLRCRRAADGTSRPLNACLCDRCRRAFKHYQHLDHVPSVAECSNELFDQWVSFRCWQNTRFWELMRQAAKEANPEATFGLYSGAPGDYSRENYGVDWTMAAPLLDFAMQRIGCPPTPHTAKALNAALREGCPEPAPMPKILIQLALFPYPDSYLYGIDSNRVYAQLPNIKNHIVRLVTSCGSFGWSFNGIWGMDDQLTLPIREANALLAKYEEYLVHGSRVDGLVETSPKSGLSVTWKHGTKTVTFAFNDTAAEQVIVLKKTNRQTARLIIPAHDCRAKEW